MEKIVNQIPMYPLSNFNNYHFICNLVLFIPNLLLLFEACLTLLQIFQHVFPKDMYFLKIITTILYVYLKITAL